ncbi:unnamed protein product [Moneuplotes crassus]|uniref:Uncharacterized protein n=1 Tax=Euplotes crassus TaxID=5936 RepID=A0AAD1X7A1_EUPCR|nr:unnamed protein product [Moneuplotes crassus]
MKNLPLSSHHLHHRPIPRTSTLHFPSNPSQSLPSKLSPKSPSQVKDMRRATVFNVGIPTVIMKREMLEKKLRKQRRCSIKKKRLETNFGKLKKGVNVIIKNTKEYNTNIFKSMKNPISQLKMTSKSQIRTSPMQSIQASRKSSYHSSSAKRSNISKNPWESLKNRYAKKAKRKMPLGGHKSKLQMKMQYFMHPYHTDVLVEKKGMDFTDGQSNWMPVANFILSDKNSMFKETIYNFMYPDVRDRILKLSKRRQANSIRASSPGELSHHSVTSGQEKFLQTVKRAIKMGKNNERDKARISPLERKYSSQKQNFDIIEDEEPGFLANKNFQKLNSKLSSFGKKGEQRKLCISSDSQSLTGSLKASDPSKQNSIEVHIKNAEEMKMVNRRNRAKFWNNDVILEVGRLETKGTMKDSPNRSTSPHRDPHKDLLGSFFNIDKLKKGRNTSLETRRNISIYNNHCKKKERIQGLIRNKDTQGMKEYLSNTSSPLDLLGIYKHLEVPKFNYSRRRDLFCNRSIS